MSPLTKAFVVLVTLLSILLVTLVVPFVAQVDDLKTEVAEANAVASASRQTIQDLRAEKTAAMEKRQSETASLNNSINQLESEKAQLEGENANLTAQLVKAQSDNQATQAALVAFGESQEANAELLQNYVGQLEAANASLVESQTENVQLVDRNNQLQSNLAALERQVRKLREDLVARSEELAQAGQGGGTTAGGSAVVRAGGEDGEPIYGRITETSQTAAGKKLVTLNLGSTDGLVANQSFVAYRGNNELVATLIVRAVDASQSVASVETEQQPVQIGDNVVSAPGLASSR